MEPLLIALTFDIEADVYDASLALSADQSDPGGFSCLGIFKGVPMLKAYLDSVTDSFDRGAKATWFLRCDDQMLSLAGQTDFILTSYAHLWDSFVAKGHEVGLHAHLYECVNGHWQQGVNADSLCQQLERSYQCFVKAGFNVATSRIGESFCSTELLAKLQSLGLQADSTAMPGRVRIDDQRTIDWGATPHQVYIPDSTDYRLPAKRSTDSAFLQIPFSMVNTLADYDDAPLLRYLDLSFHERAFQPSLDEVAQHGQLLVTVTHPSTILPELNVTGHGLLSYSFQTLVNNLESIRLACEKIDRPYRFVTLKQAVEEGLITEGTKTADVAHASPLRHQAA